MDTLHEIEAIGDARQRLDAADAAIAELQETIARLATLRRDTLVEIARDDPNPPPNGSRKSDKDPVAVIMRAWQTVDRRIAAVLTSHGLPYDHDNAAANLHLATRNRLLGGEIVRDVIALRNLRNNVLHSTVGVGESEVTAATECAERVSAALSAVTARA